jgi:hypothetical protein
LTAANTRVFLKARKVPTTGTIETRLSTVE